METITKEEILEIDSRITDCWFENNLEDEPFFYIKIYFRYKYKTGNNIIHGLMLGRESFESDNKVEIIEKIKTFMNTPKESWIIV